LHAGARFCYLLAQTQQTFGSARVARLMSTQNAQSVHAERLAPFMGLY